MSRLRHTTAPDSLPVLAVVLAGGLGTRLRHVVPGVPKVLAPVAGKPFIEWVLRYLQREGLKRVVLSVGYQAGAVETAVKNLCLPDLDISYARENEQLGTAGGVLNALERTEDDAGYVMVCNGDSLVLADLKELLTAAQKGEVDAALLAVRVKDASRYGSVRVGPDGSLTGFAEKRPGEGLVNGGVYVFDRRVLKRLPGKRPLSFELEVFPRLLDEGARIQVVESEAPFIDIGTEESFREADTFIANNRTWFS